MYTFCEVFKFTNSVCSFSMHIAGCLFVVNQVWNMSNFTQRSKVGKNTGVFYTKMSYVECTKTFMYGYDYVHVPQVVLPL